MEIRASVHNSGPEHRVVVSTNGRESPLLIPVKAGGAGSSINGGELLCVAVATCFCNDLHREAARRGLTLEAVDVDVVSEFGGPGEPARRITYSVRICGDAEADVLEALIRHTDTVAEVHNTLRAGVAVELSGSSSARGIS
jgi:organic hydroperoxide reductase OsmC/OhrA